MSPTDSQERTNLSSPLPKKIREENGMKFQQFFQTATGNEPYGWQCRLAEDPTCQSRLIDIPTGLGKTAGVVLAWLWNLLSQSEISNPQSAIPCPRRLVYCLPMRTLVEQTHREIRTWLLRLARQHTKPRDGSELRWLALHSPILLMGGEELDAPRRDWHLHPERTSGLLAVLSPFRLAYLEALIRAADCRASKQVQKQQNP